MTKLTHLAVMIAAATLPLHLRERYREEWRADLEGAAESGVKPAGVAVGALLFSATLGRNSPEISGIPVAVAVRRRARWGIAFISSAAVFFFGYSLLGGYGAASVAFETLATVGSFALLTAASVFLLLGLVQIWRAAAASSALSVVAAALVTAGIVCFSVGTLVPSLRIFAVGGVLLVFSGGVCGAVASSSAHPVATLPLRPPANWRPRRTVVIATILLAVLVTLGAVELLVWGPLAQTDGYQLAEIYAALSRSDRAYGITLIVIWIVFWMLAVAAFAIVIPRVVRRVGMTARTVLALVAALAATMVFFHFLAGFSLGMSIADTIPPYSGGMSPFGRLYAVTGQLSLVAAIFLAIAPRRMLEPAAAS